MQQQAGKSLRWRQTPPASYWPALIELARQQVAVRSDDVSCWVQLGDVLLKSGLLVEAASTLDDAKLRHPLEPLIHLKLAQVRRRLRQFDQAMTAVAAAKALQPSDNVATVMEFDLLLQMRDWPRAEALRDTIRSIAPTHSGLIQLEAQRAHRTRRYDALLAACDEVLRLAPGHTRALYCKALALAALKQDAAARDVMAIGRFMAVEDLPVPGGYGSGGQFRATVADEIMRNPTLGPDPTSRTMDGAMQSRALVQATDQALPVLIEQIKAAIDRYVERLPAGGHPFVLGRPAEVDLYAWSMVYPRDAILKPHMHPSGWLSGVTYISSPSADGRHLGPLVLGEIDQDQDPIPAPWETHEIEPVPGRLVLFPSFVPHTTRPTGVDELRIVISFDAEPQ